MLSGMIAHRGRGGVLCASQGGLPGCRTCSARLLHVPGLGRCESLVAHEAAAKGAVGRVLIVGTAAEPDSRHSGLTPSRYLPDVVELEAAARRAAATGVAHEDGMKRLTPTVSW